MLKRKDMHEPLFMRSLKRGPAPLHPKDISLVLGYSGLSSQSVVLEIGAGSGFTTVALARIAKKVISYEVRKDFYEIVSHNVSLLGLRNVVLKNEDGLNAENEKERFDLVFCDVPENHKFASLAERVLKKGGYFAAHCLHAEQAKETHLAAEECLEEVFTLESIVREYDVKKFGFRPKHIGLTHTGYLVFGRKR